MKTPPHFANKTSVTVPELINALNTDPIFEYYLWSLKYCLDNNINISPLENWWNNNHQNLVFTNVLVEFASLLEHIQITNSPIIQPVNNPPVAKNKKTQKPTKKKSPQYKHLPWINNWSKLPNSKAYNGTEDFFLVYNEYLESFAPLNTTQSKLVTKTIVIETGTQEHQHLAAISGWVSTKSNIKDTIYIFQAILKTHSPLVLYSGRAFQVACSCPHKLFRIFMESDFSGYNLENGEALSHLLSLSIAVAPDDNGRAHLTPDYPFFNNNMFTKNFNISSTSLKNSLPGAWKNFYGRYNQLCETQNNKRVFEGGGALFALTVNSLTNSNAYVTAPELTKILNGTEPNLWCLQYWLYCIILDPDSTWLQGAYLYNMEPDEVDFPEYVDYFFSIAQYVYSRGVSELSSRIMIAGIIEVFYWSKKYQVPALTILGKYFPIIFNHRRTIAINQITKYLRSKLAIFEKNSSNTPANLLSYNDYLLGILDYGYIRIYDDYSIDLANLDLVGQRTQSIQPNSPCTIHYDLNTLQISQDNDYKSIATILANIIAACLNSNGGDILITIPLLKKQIQIWPGQHFSDAIFRMTRFPHSSEFIYYMTWRSKKENYVIRVKCYRSSRPAFTNIDNVLSLPVSTSSSQNPTILNGAAADDYIAKHFPRNHQVKPIVLTI